MFLRNRDILLHNHRTIIKAGKFTSTFSNLQTLIVFLPIVLVMPFMANYNFKNLVEDITGD